MKQTRIYALLLALLLLAGCSAAPQSGADFGGAPPMLETAPAPRPYEPPSMPGLSPSPNEQETADGWVYGGNAGRSEGEAELYFYDTDGALYGGIGTADEQYLPIAQNPEQSVSEQSTVTLSLKVDTAAYTNVARYLENGSFPPPDAVRTEELLNYFSYDEPMAFGEHPFALYAELGRSPFDPDKYLAFLRVKTPDIDRQDLPPCSLTFLIDTSGSMDSYDKLPLLKEAFALLVETLGEDDRVSIVTYAGSAGVVLDGASGADKDAILRAINNLGAGGSTAGGAGIELAYRLAAKNYLDGGNNRVILATDGDFNVGISSIDALTDFIGEKHDSGVYLSALGFGAGNLRDDVMETLATHGDGNYAYINSLQTAKKVLVDELGSNLFTVADDVKAQVEFNPANVASWRLIGYENRQMANEDFDNDFKDAGEIGAGTDVVALFELTLAGGGGGQYPDELFELRVRYKDPGGAVSRLAVFPVDFGRLAETNSADFHFAASVAMWGEHLRGSDFSGDIRLDQITALAEENIGKDPGGYRAAHIELLRRA